MKLNKKKVAVLGLAGLLALGGAGGALAYIIKGATDTKNVTNESAVILDWSENSISCAIDDLTPAAPVYKEIGFDISKSTNANGGAKLTFSITKDTSTRLEEGQKLGDFKVSISTTDWSSIGTRQSVTISTKTGSDNIAEYTVSLDTTKTKKLYLKFETDYISASDTANYILAGTVNASLTYAASFTDGSLTASKSA